MTTIKELKDKYKKFNDESILEKDIILDVYIKDFCNPNYLYLTDDSNETLEAISNKELYESLKKLIGAKNIKVKGTLSCTLFGTLGFSISELIDKS